MPGNVSSTTRGAITLAAMLAALVAASTGATKSAAPHAVALRSGDLAVFRGTSLQCLAFGPVAQVKGKNGVLCFKGPRGQHKLGTWWASTTKRSIDAAPGDSAVFRAVTSHTTIRRTVRISLDGSVRVAHAGVTCWFQISERVAPGQRIVLCVDADNRGPRPGGDGFVLSERLLAIVEFDADRKVGKVGPVWRHER